MPACTTCASKRHKVRGQALHCTREVRRRLLSSFTPRVLIYKLIYLALAVCGDLSSIQKSTKLHKILLSDLKIEGDIAVFRPCLSLKKVWLRCTNVRGDVGFAFERTTLLVDVLLRKCSNVRGDIGVFGHCLRLQNVALSRTKVSGAIDAFRGCHALRVLALEFCDDITGSRSAIERALPLCEIHY